MVGGRLKPRNRTGLQLLIRRRDCSWGEALGLKEQERQGLKARSIDNVLRGTPMAGVFEPSRLFSPAEREGTSVTYRRTNVRISE